MIGIDARATILAFNFNFAIGTQEARFAANPLDSSQALGLLKGFFGFLDAFAQGRPAAPAQLPGCGCLPPPSVNLSGPPAGQGLRQNPDGSVTTAGGYTIKAEGKDAAWQVIGPDGKSLTRVWGDPHVDEADGTKWDFTKSSDFVLPDGTRVHVKTSYDPAKGNGHSVSTGLEITNGADRASVRGVDTGRPATTLSQDGYEWRAAHLASDPSRDSFHLAGDGNTVQWVRERNGKLDGVIGEGRGHMIDAGNHRIYEQKIDANQKPFLDPRLQPPVGSPAWGNMLRNELNDAQAGAWGRLLGHFGIFPATATAAGMHGEHLQAQVGTALLRGLFGGLGSYFPAIDGPMSALTGLIDLMRADSTWRQQFRFGQSQLMLN